MRIVDQPLVSVVIPSFNSLSFIEDCVRSVLATSYPNLEVIFVDDHSLDGSFELVKNKFGSGSRLRIVRNEKKLQAAATRNVGFRAARGKYVALLDHDVEVHPDWIGEMVKVLESVPHVGAVQGKVLDIENRSVIAAIGMLIVQHVGWVICRGFGEVDRGQYDYPADVLSGATGVMYRRDLVLKLGGFDEALAYNFDDLDLGWRIWLSGERVLTVPASVTYHWTFKPWKVKRLSISRLEWEFHFNKMPRVFLKNYELKNVFKYAPWVLLMLGFRALANLIKLNPMPLLGFVVATLWNIVILPNTILERRRIQRTLRKVSDDYVMSKVMVARGFSEVWSKYMPFALRRGKFQI